MKNIQIDGELHKQVKVSATLAGLTIRELTERALRDYLRANRLVDTREPYTVKEETNA